MSHKGELQTGEGSTTWQAKHLDNTVSISVQNYTLNEDGDKKNARLSKI